MPYNAHSSPGAPGHLLPVSGDGDPAGQDRVRGKIRKRTYETLYLAKRYGFHDGFEAAEASGAHAVLCAVCAIRRPAGISRRHGRLRRLCATAEGG